MKSRAEKLGRLVSLVKLQLRLSEWQLAQLRQQESELADQESYLIGAFNDVQLPIGSSSESISRRLTATSVSARATQARASRQLEQVQVEGRRVKQLERIATAATVNKLRDAERRLLEEIAGAFPASRINGF
ncbi:MAG TPA: hypothetical protein VJU82_04760 [Acidobacteriaceae bacterium]|nr:hypothetical protein [Acidobacteriaceae bacterium]